MQTTLGERSSNCTNCSIFVQKALKHTHSCGSARTVLTANLKLSVLAPLLHGQESQRQKKAM